MLEIVRLRSGRYAIRNTQTKFLVPKSRRNINAKTFWTMRGAMRYADRIYDNYMAVLGPGSF